MPKRKKPLDDDEGKVVVLFADHFREEVTPHPVSDDDTTIVNSGQVGGRRKSTRERRGTNRWDPLQVAEFADPSGQVILGEGFICPNCNEACAYDASICDECHCRVRYVPGEGGRLMSDQTLPFDNSSSAKASAEETLMDPDRASLDEKTDSEESDNKETDCEESDAEETVMDRDRATLDEKKDSEESDEQQKDSEESDTEANATDKSSKATDKSFNASSAEASEEETSKVPTDEDSISASDSENYNNETNEALNSESSSKGEDLAEHTTEESDSESDAPWTPDVTTSPSSNNPHHLFTA